MLIVCLRIYDNNVVNIGIYFTWYQSLLTYNHTVRRSSTVPKLVRDYVHAYPAWNDAKLVPP